MGIGISVFLIALGAILAFAVNVDLNGLDISVVGVILMIAGLVGLATSLFLFGPRRRRAAAEPVYEERVYRDPDVY